MKGGFLFFLFFLGNLALCGVSQGSFGWRAENAYLKFTLLKADLSWEIEEKSSGTVWRTIPQADLFLKNLDKPLSLASAQTKRMERLGENAFSLLLSDFPSVRDLEVHLTFRLEGDHLFYEFDIPKGGDLFQGLVYPGSFDVAKFSKDYFALPIRSGCLIPGNWKEPLNLRYPYGGAWWGMAWFGGVKEKSAFLTILLTPYDATIHIQNPPGGPPMVNFSWEASFATLRYPRKALYIFKDISKDALPAYNWMSKRYREYVKKVGLFKPIGERIKRLPNINKLFGAVVVPALIAWYDKQTPNPTLTYTTFADTSQKLQKLYDMGLRKVYIHLDGWGRRGYDNLHPDPLPPCPEAGGWEGLRALSLKAKELGFLFGLHDNYRDYYLDSPAFDEAFTLKDANGKSPRYSVWAGGEQSVLCPACALPFVKRTFEEMKKHGVHLTAYYLDVFSSVPPEECYDPKHPVTREDSTRYRNQCLDYVNSLGIIVTSEDGADWAIPTINMPYWIPPPGFGVTVPLFQLVYHDSLLVPNDILAGDDSYLRALLYGELPMVGIDAPRKAFQNALLVAHLQEQVGKAELLWHRFLGDDYSVQETCFSNGVKVWADFKNKMFKVTGAKGFPSEARKIPSLGYDIRVRVSDFKYIGGRTFEITYEWDVGEALEGDYYCFNHFLNEGVPQGEHIAFGADHLLPIPTSQWKPGDKIKDGPHRVTIPEDLPYREYEVVIGLFDRERGPRTPLLGCDPNLRLHLGKIKLEGEKEVEKILFLSF